MHDDDCLGARVSLLEQANRGRLGSEAEMLAKIRDLHECRHTDRQVMADVLTKLDRLLLLVPTLARQRVERAKRRRKAGKR